MKPLTARKKLQALHILKAFYIQWDHVHLDFTGFIVENRLNYSDYMTVYTENINYLCQLMLR